MGESSGANMPLAADGRYYHLHTRPGYLAPFCLLVGDPDRATLIAENFFEHIERTGDHRGLRWYTGIYRDVPVSVVTTGMGSPSLCVVVPEAYDSGARMFIRVGTCGSLIEDLVPATRSSWTGRFGWKAFLSITLPPIFPRRPIPASWRRSSARPSDCTTKDIL